MKRFITDSCQNSFTNIKRTWPISKKYHMKNQFNNDSDDEEVELPKAKKLEVYAEQNHIYFRGDVTIDKVNKLCELIEGYNREHDFIKLSSFTSIVIPKPIYLHITSWGGDLIAGFLAHDYIKNSKIPIYTIADGYAVSSGSTMFMAGRRRFMTKNSYILIHQLNQTDYSTNTFHNVMDNALNVIEFMGRIYKLVLENVRYDNDEVNENDMLTKEKLENHVLHDIYWDFDTCRKFGLVDELYVNYDKADEVDILKIVEQTTKVPTLVNVDSRNYQPSADFIEKITHQSTMSKNKSDIVNAVALYLQQNSDKDDEPIVKSKKPRKK